MEAMKMNALLLMVRRWSGAAVFGVEGAAAGIRHASLTTEHYSYYLNILSIYLTGSRIEDSEPGMARDLRYLPLPLNRFAKRVFVRHLPKQYQGIPRDVIWSDWAGPDGGDGYFAGDFELWFHDAGNKEQNDIWLPSEL